MIKNEIDRSNWGKHKFKSIQPSFMSRLYYEIVARVLVVGIIPVGLLIFLNTKIFLALKKIRTSQIKNSSLAINNLSESL